MDKWKKIENILKNNLEIADGVARDKLVEKISIYHEELLFQNKELSSINKRLEKMKNDYQELFDFAPVAYFIVDKAGRIIDANANAKVLFGHTAGSTIIRYVEPGSRKLFWIFLEELFKENTGRINSTFVSWNTSLHMEVIGKRIVSREDNFLIACIDCEQQYRVMEKMNNLSYRDSLTGLYNRRYFEKEIRQINPQKDLPFSVIMADVNGLKILNDSFGHQKGDELLKKSAQLMSELGSKKHVIARTGGDEFAILLPNTTRSDCKKLMEQFYTACSRLTVDGIKFSTSFGMGTMTSVMEDLDDVIAGAEEEMYRSKLLNEVASNSEIVESIFAVLCKKSPKEELHSKRVSSYMKDFGEYLGYNEERIELMHLAGLVHDIGKVTLMDIMLDKTGTLSVDDYGEIKKSTEISYRILKSSSKFSKVAPIILYCNEWVNGKGYPKGLTGEYIPFESKALSVCNAFEVMTSDQPYRAAMTRADALAELEASAGIQFDEDVVRDFVEMIKKKDK